jgi:hypothetical protein
MRNALGKTTMTKFVVVVFCLRRTDESRADQDERHAAGTHGHDNRGSSTPADPRRISSAPVVGAVDDEELFAVIRRRLPWDGH